MTATEETLHNSIILGGAGILSALIDYSLGSDPRFSLGMVWSGFLLLGGYFIFKESTQQQAGDQHE